MVVRAERLGEEGTDEFRASERRTGVGVGFGGNVLGRATSEGWRTSKGMLIVERACYLGVEHEDRKKERKKTKTNNQTWTGGLASVFLSLTFRPSEREMKERLS